MYKGYKIYMTDKPIRYRIKEEVYGPTFLHPNRWRWQPDGTQFDNRIAAEAYIDRLQPDNWVEVL